MMATEVQQMTAVKERLENLDEVGLSYLHVHENEAPQLCTAACKQGSSKTCEKQHKHQRSITYLRYQLHIIHQIHLKTQVTTLSRNAPTLDPSQV